jgi:uncharacterized membrane protein
VAIAISLVPPLAVVGLTLESGAPRQSLAAFVLFVTNLAAILASGIVVMAFHRVHRVFGAAVGSRYGGAVAIIGALLLVVIIPLWINSDRIDKTSVRQSEVQAVAERWVNDAGWSVTGVTATGDQVFIEAIGAALLAFLSSVTGEPAGPGVRCAVGDERCTSWIREPPDCVMEGTAGNG